MGLAFTKATKRKAKLRLAMFGPSGAGKSFSALRIATGLGGRIGAIDTERGSLSKYADRFDFDVLELPDFSIETYCAAIESAADAGFDVLLIDSLSHGWQQLVEAVDKLAQAKYRGNTWSAWSEGTPKQRRLVSAILGFPGHVIATIRSKTEWTTEQGSGGKSQPKRVGLAPEQGKGIEYEFDMLIEMSTEHLANVIKDRTGRYQDKILDRPDEKLGQALAAWLDDGEEAPVASAPDTRADVLAQTRDRVGRLVRARRVTGAGAKDWLRETFRTETLDTLTLDQLTQVGDWLDECERGVNGAGAGA